MRYNFSNLLRHLKTPDSDAATQELQAFFLSSPEISPEQKATELAEYLDLLSIDEAGSLMPELKKAAAFFNYDGLDLSLEHRIQAALMTSRLLQAFKLAEKSPEGLKINAGILKELVADFLCFSQAALNSDSLDGEKEWGIAKQGGKLKANLGSHIKPLLGIIMRLLILSKTKALIEKETLIELLALKSSDDSNLLNIIKAYDNDQLSPYRDTLALEPLEMGITAPSSGPGIFAPTHALSASALSAGAGSSVASLLAGAARSLFTPRPATRRSGVTSPTDERDLRNGIN